MKGNDNMFTLNEMKEIKKGLELLGERYEQDFHDIYPPIALENITDDDVAIIGKMTNEIHDIAILIEKTNSYINMINYTIENQ